MASTYTTNLGLTLPTTGELAGTWGSTVNTGVTTLIDSAIAGTETLTTDADVTLTNTTGAANQARMAILNCTGARTLLRNITAPAATKEYTVINATTGGFSVVIRGVGPTTGVTVLNGQKVHVAWNGTDFVKVSSSTIAMASEVTGTLPVANGGTGTTTLTLNNVLLGNGTSALQAVAPGTNGNVLTSNGTTWISTAAGTVNWAVPGTIGSTTPNTGAFTTLSASSTVSGTGFSTYLASPPAIGGTTPAAGKFTTATANSFIPNSATVPTNGMYLGAANTLNWATNGVLRLTLSSVGALTATDNVTAYSDERLKKNWRDLPVDFVSQLAHVKMGVYDRTDHESTQVGVSAQSLQTVMPNAVMEQADGMLSVAYGNAALAACVMLAREVEVLKLRLVAVEAA